MAVVVLFFVFACTKTEQKKEVTAPVRKLTLLRINTQETIVGVLFFSGGGADNAPLPLCYTLENQNYVYNSGNYNYKVVTHKRFGRCIKIEDKNGRRGIYFHSGNTQKDTRGCTLVGTHFVNSKHIAGSRNALNKITKEIETEGIITVLN